MVLIQAFAIHLAGEELVCSVAQTPRWSALYAEEGRRAVCRQLNGERRCRSSRTRRSGVASPGHCHRSGGGSDPFVFWCLTGTLRASGGRGCANGRRRLRSEEHTSELQSLR